MFRPPISWTLLLLAACATSRPEPVASPESVRSVAASQAADERRAIVFEGACDASGAVVLDRWHFVVGDDEDNVLRVYDLRTGGPPVRTVDLNPDLDLPEKKKPPEADIEAATGLGDLELWLSSHGRSSSGKKAVSRLRFFATRRLPDGSLEMVGTPYQHLLSDLLEAPHLSAYGLASAAALPPKEPGGINVEGMTATGDGESVMIGFRNPVPQGRALGVSLLNPTALIKGKPAKFGPARLLDLKGLGIRSMSRWRGRYLLVGGPISSGVPSRMFTWSGESDEPVEVEFDFSGFNPEAFVSHEESDEILVLSDDGSRLHDGVECKRLKDPAQKRFRGVWVRP